jgi:HEAT repeat protein
MFSNVKWMMIKNDIEKMVSTYEKDKELRPQIIDRLFELDAKKDLFGIAAWDSYYRNRIVEKATKLFDLELDDCIQIFQWLQISQTHKYFVGYVLDKFDDRAIRTILNARGIEKITLSAIKNALKKRQRENPDEVLDESYLRLKMLVEDLDLENNEASSELQIFNENLSFEENIQNFLDIIQQQSIEEEFETIKNALKQCMESKCENYLLILSILNLARLSAAKKRQLAHDINSPNIFYPEIFQGLSHSRSFSIENYKKFFSVPTFHSWSENFIKTHLVTEFKNIADQFEDFSWLKTYIPKSMDLVFEMTSKSQHFCILTNKYGYRLYDLIIKEETLEKLKETSFAIHKRIQDSILDLNAPIQDLITPLIQIGGDFNFSFLATLLRRTVVKDPTETIKNIEANYLELKHKIDDPTKLRELIENEIAEKSDLIPKKHFHKILSSYLGSFITSHNIPTSIQENIASYLPNIERSLYLANPKEKTEICNLIAKFKLDEYTDLMAEVANSDDKAIALSATLALINLDQPGSMEKLNGFTKSDNFKIRKLASEGMRVLPLDTVKGMLLLLCKDENLEVIKAAISTLLSYPFSEIFELLKKMSKTLPLHARQAFAEALGELGQEKTIPMLVDLLRTTDLRVTYSVIQALGKIQHNGAIEVLKSIDLKGNHILEIERSKSLIHLGDFESWTTLKKLLKVNLSLIQLHVKFAMVQLASSGNIKDLESFVHDPNPIIASAAVAKIYIYNQDLGWRYIARLISNPDPKLRYYLVHLLKYFPFSQIKSYLVKLYQTEDYKLKTIISIFLDEQGFSSYWSKLDKGILQLHESQIAEVLDALIDYPYLKSISLLERVAILQDPELIEKIVNICRQLPFSEVASFFKRTWAKADSDCRLVLASLLSQVDSLEVQDFIYKELVNNELGVKIELSYALVAQGDNKGWVLLRELLNNESLEVKRFAIEKIAKFGTVSALKILEKQGLTPDVKVQEEVIKAIGEMKLKEAIPTLERFIRSSSKKVKTSVAKALGELPYPESERLLLVLLQDADNYVKVAAEISLSKFKSGPPVSLPTTRGIFTQIMRQPDWRLTEEWFEKRFHEMETKYFEDESIPLSEFPSKIIIDKQNRAKRQKKIQDDLTKMLSGCTDVDKIIAAKTEAQKQIDRMATINELIKAILYAPNDNMAKAEIVTLRQALKTGHPEIVRAALLASCHSEEDHWLYVLEQIIYNYFDPRFIDLLIFSIVRKRNTNSLFLLTYLLSSERARYYYITLYNYLTVNTVFIETKDLDKIEKVVASIKLSKNIKEVVLYIVEKLRKKVKE